MLDQDVNKKRMLLFMRFMRMIAAALVALGLLYLVHKNRQKKAEPDPTPTAQTAPAETPLPENTAQE
jgi:hypothetical protein